MELTKKQENRLNASIAGVMGTIGRTESWELSEIHVLDNDAPFWMAKVTVTFRPHVHKHPVFYILVRGLVSGHTVNDEYFIQKIYDQDLPALRVALETPDQQ